MKPYLRLVSAHADHRIGDYRFARQRADRLYVPMERTPPVWRRWGQTAFGAAVLAVLMAALLIAPAVIARVL